jgi:large subunit ribosomal protein L4
MNSEGETVGSAVLLPNIFGIEPNHQILYEAVKIYLGNQRQGTASTKGRSEVRGGGTKPWRQKGTGRARSGTNRSPLWVGGGITFGPKPRTYRSALPKKMNRLARQSAFSIKAQEGKIQIIEDMVFDEPKTKRIISLLNALDLQDKKVLFLIAKAEENLLKSCRNVSNIIVRQAREVAAYDVINSEVILLTKESLAQIEEVLGA